MAAHSSSSLAPPNIATLVFVKLTDTNDFLWEGQVKPFLVGHNLWRFIDRSYPCPSITLLDPASMSTNDKPATIPNPAYLPWYQADQSLVSQLRATLTKPVLSQVVGLAISHAIWECLEQNFSNILLPTLLS